MDRVEIPLFRKVRKDVSTCQKLDYINGTTSSFLKFMNNSVRPLSYIQVSRYPCRLSSEFSYYVAEFDILQ